LEKVDKPKGSWSAPLGKTAHGTLNPYEKGKPLTKGQTGQERGLGRERFGITIPALSCATISTATPVLVFPVFRER